MKSPLKHRLVRTAEKYAVNPLVKALLAVGVPMPLAVLETTGRRSGKPRRTVVADGRVGNSFWVVAEHGEHAAYIRNLSTNPKVRVRTKRRWMEGTAHVLPDDDPYARAAWVADQLWRSPWVERAAARLLGVDPITVRIDLDRTDGAHSLDRPTTREARERRDRRLGAGLVALSGGLMAWAGYLFATAGLNAALLESIVPGITIEAGYAAYRRVDRATGRARPTGWTRLAQEAAGLSAGMVMAVGGFAAVRWGWPVATAAILVGLPVIYAAIVIGRSHRTVSAEPELAR